MNDLTTTNTKISESELMERPKVDSLSQLTHADNNIFMSMSIAPDDLQAKKRAYNAVNNPNEKLKDFINKKIKAVDVVAFPVEIVDDTTGEVIQCLKTNIIDEKGVVYTATSKGIASSLQKIFAIVGFPTWNPPLEMEVKKLNCRKQEREAMVLELL